MIVPLLATIDAVAAMNRLASAVNASVAPRDGEEPPRA